MTLRWTMAWLVILACASIATMTIAAGSNDRSLVALGALAFLAGAVVASMVTNVPVWRRGAAEPTVSAHPEATMDAASRRAISARRNVRLLSVTCAWAALALNLMFVPHFTGLVWRPGWSVAVILAALAVAWSLVGYALLLHDRGSSRRRSGWLARSGVTVLMTVQSLMAGLVLMATSASGWLVVRTPDWAAAALLAIATTTLMLQGAMALRSDAVLRASSLE